MCALHIYNKCEAVIEMSIVHNIGCIIVDNFYEITLLEKLLKRKNKQMDVLIRVTPGIESETHRYIMTGNEDSKFGLDRKSTRLNSSHVAISYAVFCLKKKKNRKQ